MNFVYLILGGFGLLALLESRHKTISAGAGMASNGSPGGGPGFGTITTMDQLRASGGMGPSGADTGVKFGAEGFGAFSSLAGSGLLGAGLKGAQAIPIAGAVIGIGMSIYAAISAHHKQALAAEGKALNDATPRMVQTYALIVQAAVRGEIRSQQVANDLADRTRDLFYGEVKPIQHGIWPYTGQDMTADYEKVWLHRFQPPKGAPGYSDYHAPDPCNGACVMGHFFAERDAFLVKFAVRDILAGKHGSVVFPQIPPHETQQGYPQVAVTY